MEPKEDKTLEGVWVRLAEKARNDTEMRMAFDELLKFTLKLEAKYRQMKRKIRRESLMIRKPPKPEP